MSSLITLQTNDSAYSDIIVDQLMRECDENVMPLPDIGLEPYLLISKVRKHYMDYLIQLLSVNYEKSQQLLNKNIYLPSAIWRCAKTIEMNAAQTSMVAQLYRKNIVAVIKELKVETKKGKLHKKLYNCLRKPAENEKKVQVSIGLADNCTCQCTCNQRKRRRRSETPPKNILTDNTLPPISHNSNFEDIGNNSLESILTGNVMQIQKFSLPQVTSTHAEENPPNKNLVMPQDSDELMTQLEKLFHADPNDDDIFEGGLCDILETTANDENNKKNNIRTTTESPANVIPTNLIETHAAQIKSLDERLASLTGMLVSNQESTHTAQKHAPNQINSEKKPSTAKWLCEEYFMKVKLYELLDEIGDNNRKKLLRIKKMFVELFGEEGDEQGVVSPLDETPEFVLSCKERIAPWVVKLLTPFYIKGRIRGKALFKSVAKHLIRLIYQCSKYPKEYEVQNFVQDFLNNHKMIRCESDYKSFRIDNI